MKFQKLLMNKIILSRIIIFWFQVVLERQYTFRNSKASYTGVPVMAANMDTTGTFEIAKCFHDHGLFVCIHKHYRLIKKRNYYFRKILSWKFIIIHFQIFSALTNGNSSLKKILMSSKILLWVLEHQIMIMKR